MHCFYILFPRKSLMFKKKTILALCISCLDMLSNPSDSFFQICSETGIDNHLNFISLKVSIMLAQLITTYFL